MRTTPAIAALLFCTVLASSAAAQDETPERRYGKFYNGAFVDVSARAALNGRRDYSGFSWDVGLRQALVMHLLDTRISYAEDRWGGNTSELPSIVVRSVSIHGAFHPLYMALLYSDWLGYLIASWYVEAGIGGQYATSTTNHDFGLRLSLGSGFDVPITDPDRGWSIWLNALYRYTWNDFDALPSVFGDRDVKLHHHAGWLGVSLRFNGLLF